MAASKISTSAWPCTVARSVARLTAASVTPGTALIARSTRPTHDAQVMPPMDRLMVAAVVLRASLIFGTLILVLMGFIEYGPSLSLTMMGRSSFCVQHLWFASTELGTASSDLNHSRMGRVIGEGAQDTARRQIGEAPFRAR